MFREFWEFWVFGNFCLRKVYKADWKFGFEMNSQHVLRIYLGIFKVAFRIWNVGGVSGSDT